MTMYDGKEMMEGLIFVKSMMSLKNVQKQVAEDVKYAMKAGVHCEKMLLDDSYSKSVDRDAMCKLLESLDGSEIQVLVVEDIYDITRDASDLRAMMDRINAMGIIIFDLSTMSARFNNYEREC